MDSTLSVYMIFTQKNKVHAISEIYKLQNFILGNNLFIYTVFKKNKNYILNICLLGTRNGDFSQVPCCVDLMI